MCVWVCVCVYVCVCVCVLTCAPCWWSVCAFEGLADGSGRATTALIREFIAEHGEAAFAAKEDALLAMAKRYAGAGSSTVWEDVRDDGSSEGAWFNQFKWRGADGRTQ